MSRIGESELIINSDGSVFHLHMKPEELADDVIIVGDPGRAEMIASHFETKEFMRQSREFVTCTGLYKGDRITVLSSGIGTDNIDIVLTELDACANINLETREINPKHRKLNLIRLGTSGSLQEDIPCGAFLASKYVIGIDGLMYFYQNNENVLEKELADSFVSFMNWDESLPKPYGVEVSDSLFFKIAYENTNFDRKEKKKVNLKCSY